MRTGILSYMLLLLTLSAAAQQEPKGTGEFTLQAAVDYALKHNTNYLNAELEILQTKYKKNEITGLGLPQITGSFDVRDLINVPTFVVANRADTTGKYPYAPFQMGLKYSVNPNISISQLIINSDYFMGVLSSKQYMLLAEKNVQRGKADVIQNVSKAYYMVLINKERIKLLDANLIRLKKLLDDTKAYNKEGLVEKIDVDRLEVNYNNLVTEKAKTERLIDLSEALLKFQMGYKLSDAIVLSDKLNAEAPINSEISEESKINFSNRPEFSILETQQRINQIDIRRGKMAYLPNIVAYASLGYNAYNIKFNFMSKSNPDNPLGKYYPSTVIGATLNLPIFDGLQKHWKIQQAKLNLVKTSNSLQGLQMAIEFEAKSASVNYQNALASMETQKKNMALAQSIYDVSEKKYQQGLGSNVEMLNAQTSLAESQTNYFNAIYDMLVAKLDYMKATGALVK